MPDLPTDFFDRPLADVDPEVAEAVAAALGRGAGRALVEGKRPAPQG